MAHSAELEPVTILTVENEAIFQLELSDWLSEIGLLVLVADGADEAIERMVDHPEIAILMTDIKMPGSMDGIALSHYVRDRWPKVGIIVGSGMTDTQSCQLPEGAVFLPKPLELGQVWRAVTTLVNRAAPIHHDRPPTARTKQPSRPGPRRQ
jgi:DNA-binding NtrC family response regulator